MITLSSDINIKFMIIQSMSQSDSVQESDYAFKEIIYVIMKMQIVNSENLFKICLNTDCSVIIENHKFLKIKLLNFNKIIQKLDFLIFIKDIDN